MKLRAGFIVLSVAVIAAAQTPPVDTLKQAAVEMVDGRRQLTQRIVDSLFSFAELGYQEYESSAYLCALLEKEGFQVTRGVAGLPTAFVATWGSGKPVIGFMTDIDGLPSTSQKPGVPRQEPLIADGPGHGEGHNTGMGVNITAAIVVKELMKKHGIPGTIRVYPGIAEELIGSRTYMVNAGLFRDLDVMLSSHVSADFGTGYGGPSGTGLISTMYTFHGRSAHSAASPWSGRSALDAVELMDAGWNFRREHLNPQHRSHYVIVNGGEQPNVVPPLATVWYYFREWDYEAIVNLHEIGTKIARAAAEMTDTTMSERMLASAWPGHFNKPLAEALQANIQRVGMPAWSEADQKLARAAQRELKAKEDGLKTEVGKLKEAQRGDSYGSDDIAEVSWNVPTVSAALPVQHPRHDRPSLVQRHRGGDAHRPQGRHRRRQGACAHRARSAVEARTARRRQSVLRRADQDHQVEIADPDRHETADRPEPREDGAPPPAASKTPLRRVEVPDLPGAIGHPVPAPGVTCGRGSSGPGSPARICLDI